MDPADAGPGLGANEPPREVFPMKGFSKRTVFLVTSLAVVAAPAAFAEEAVFVASTGFADGEGSAIVRDSTGIVVAAEVWSEGLPAGHDAEDGEEEEDYLPFLPEKSVIKVPQGLLREFFSELNLSHLMPLWKIVRGHRFPTLGNCQSRRQA
mgnify:CR=1 FL=1